jgi:hypothetical protein
MCSQVTHTNSRFATDQYRCRTFDNRVGSACTGTQITGCCCWHAADENGWCPRTCDRTTDVRVRTWINHRAHVHICHSCCREHRASKIVIPITTIIRPIGTGSRAIATCRVAERSIQERSLSLDPDSWLCVCCCRRSVDRYWRSIAVACLFDDVAEAVVACAHAVEFVLLERESF